VNLKQDEFSNQPKIWGVPGHSDGGRELTDDIAKRLRFLIEETYSFLPSKVLFEDVLIDIAHQNRFHPVRDYLDGLTWDGVPRIDNWLVTYAGAEDTPFNLAVGRIFLIAAVRRVRRPGCKFDTMLVLKSPAEGKNKSQAVQLLAAHEEWFADHLPLGADPKIVIEQCCGSWIIECAELT
jgi:predicted P-loop ATPase